MPETIYEGKAVHGFNFSSFIFSYGTCAASPFSALSIKRNDDFLCGGLPRILNRLLLYCAKPVTSHN